MSDCELGGSEPTGAVLVIPMALQTPEIIGTEEVIVPSADTVQTAIWHAGTATAINPTMRAIVRKSLRMFRLADTDSPRRAVDSDIYSQVSCRADGTFSNTFERTYLVRFAVEDPRSGRLGSST